MKTETEKPKAPSLSELQWMRMEYAKKAFDRDLRDAEARGGPTQTELCGLRVRVIEQDIRRDRWAAYLRSEGKRVNLLDSKPTFAKGIRITNGAGEVPTVWLYGDLGPTGNTEEEFAEEFQRIHPYQDVILRIRSDGGDVITSLAMRDVILSRTGRVDAYIDGMAASGATLVACACTSVTMGLGSQYMIHEAAGSIRSGRVDDFESGAVRLKETNDTLVKIYSQRWKGTRQQLIDALHAETWFTAEEAVTAGFADRVSNKVSLAASVSPDRHYRNTPAALQIAAKIDRPGLMAAEMALHRLAIIR